MKSEVTKHGICENRSAVNFPMSKMSGVMKTSAWCRPRKSQTSTLSVDVNRRPDWAFLLVNVNQTDVFSVYLDQTDIFSVDVDQTELLYWSTSWSTVGAVDVHFTDVFITPKMSEFVEAKFKFVDNYQTFNLSARWDTYSLHWLAWSRKWIIQIHYLNRLHSPSA